MLNNVYGEAICFMLFLIHYIICLSDICTISRNKMLILPISIGIICYFCKSILYSACIVHSASVGEMAQNMRIANQDV